LLEDEGVIIDIMLMEIHCPHIAARGRIQ